MKTAFHAVLSERRKEEARLALLFFVGSVIVQKENRAMIVSR